MKTPWEKKIARNDIHAILLGLSGTVPDFDTLSRRPGNYEIVPEIKKKKSMDFLRPTEREGFVINSCLKDKCCKCCPENARKSRKIKSIVPDLSEKIMACMRNEQFLLFSQRFLLVWKICHFYHI